MFFINKLRKSAQIFISNVAVVIFLLALVTSKFIVKVTPGLGSSYTVSVEIKLSFMGNLPTWQSTQDEVTTINVGGRNCWGFILVDCQCKDDISPYLKHPTFVYYSSRLCTEFTDCSWQMVKSQSTILLPVPVKLYSVNLPFVVQHTQGSNLHSLPGFAEPVEL